MSLRSRRRELQGLVGGIGVIIALAGFVGGYMSSGATIVWTFAVWIIGSTLVNLFTDPPQNGGE